MRSWLVVNSEESHMKLFGKESIRQSVLFVSWTSRNSRPYSDPSVRYRCFNPCQEFVRRGGRAQVISQIQFEKHFEDIPQYDKYIFHRPYLNGFLADVMSTDRFREASVADFDDLIFDVRHAEMTPMVRVRGTPAIQTRQYIASTAEAAGLFLRMTLSTRPLLEHSARLFPNAKAKIVHNAVDRGYVGLAKLIRDQNPFERRPYAYGYFSGTATHDLDFRIAADGLRRRFEKDKAARMLVVGPLKLPEVLDGFKDRVDCTDIVPFHQLPYLMAKCKTVLGPLERTVFTESKSGLKFFEAALVGCNVIATPIPDIDRFESILLEKCSAPADWDAAFDIHRPISAAQREAAVKEVEELVRIESIVPAWADFVGLNG